MVHVHFKGSQVRISKLTLKIGFSLAISADPGVMQPSVRTVWVKEITTLDPR